MGSFGAGIASVGGSLAEAQELRRQDALKKQQSDLEQSRFGLEKDRFNFQKQQANRPSYKGFAQVGGKMVALVQDPDGKMRVQSFDTVSQDAFSQATMKAIEGIKDPALKQAAQDEAGMYLSQGDTKGAFGAVKSRIDKAQADTEAESRRTQQETFSKEQQGRQFKEEEKLVGMRKRLDDTGGLPEKTLKALADKWINEGIKPPSKYQAPVEAYMEERGQKGKVKLTSQEQAVADGIKQVSPMIDRLVNFIEKNKLQDQNGWVFGDNSALSQHLKFYGYQKGKAPDASSSELIKDAAAIQVQGAKPLMTMGRSKYMYETIVQHLPQPTDTPKLLYDKVTWLRDNVIENAKDSLPEGWDGAGQKSGQNIDSVLDDVFGKK